MHSDFLLEVRNLTKSYETSTGRLTVLKDVSLAIHPGDTWAIIGPSGSGKTTLLGLCAGLDVATSGSVHLIGQDLGVLDEDGRARLRNQSVGFVFQNFQLLPTLTALENVMVPLELRGDPAVQSHAVELLEKVGLGKRLDHYPAQLSGGEQQRVALARAFVNRPRILFADEPTGNLDGETSHAIVQMLFDLNKEAGTALVLVTHDPELARKAGRILQLRSGSQVQSGPAIGTTSPQ